MSGPVLQVSGLQAAYGRIRALHGVDLEVHAGEAVTIIGANGAGKTTLLRTVAGLMPPTGGRVHLDGRDLTGAPAEACVRAGLSLVPEGRQVFPSLSVVDNLRLGAYARRRDPDVDADLEQVLDLFPVLAERRAQPAGTLSGGEQQMLAVGRGLMSSPEVLLLDEPSLGLAPLAIRDVVDQLKRLVASGTTILLVEQNARAALKVASRGYVLAQGRVILGGTNEELLDDERVRSAYLGSGGLETTDADDEAPEAPARSPEGSGQP